MIIQQGRTLTHSAQILDGIVKNVDIEAAAGIEGSKIQEISLGVNAGVIPIAGIVNAMIAATAAIALSKMGNETQGNIIYYGAGGVPAVLAPGDSGKFLKTNGAAADPTWTALGAKRLTSSDNLQASADTERQVASGSTYTQKAAFAAPHTGFYRIKFDIKRTGSNITSYGQVYRNGTAHGTEQTTTSTSYVTKSENLFFNAGDVIEVMQKAYNYGGEFGLMRNARVYYDENTLLDTCEVLADN